MKAAPVFIVLAVGAILGWVAPDLARTVDEAPAVHDGLAPVAEPQRPGVDALRQRQWYAGEVVVPRAGDGHFYVDVTVEGASSRMLVDTGASVIALTGADAAKMGIHWNKAQLQPVASGASGPVHGVHVMLRDVRVGRLQASGVRAVVVPEGLGVSLLGQSFLSRVGQIAIEPGRMVLGG